MVMCDLRKGKNTAFDMIPEIMPRTKPVDAERIKGNRNYGTYGRAAKLMSKDGCYMLRSSVVH